MLWLLGVILVPFVLGTCLLVWSRGRQKQEQAQADILHRKHPNEYWARSLWQAPKRVITLKEFWLMQLIAVSFAVGGFFYIRFKALEDVEYWNGRITEKLSGSQSCCHCREVCATCRDSQGNTYSCACYEVCSHPEDHFWSLRLSTGDTLLVDNCEPDPKAIPPVWYHARIREPASVAKTYRNYLKADPDSLLQRGAPAEYLAEVPPYPTVFDVYKMHKALSVGVPLEGDWDGELRRLNADLGAAKQVDITAVFTNRSDPRWADALEAKWLYGPKNALILVLGVPDGKTIQWARVVTISRVEPLKLALRRALEGQPIADPKPLVQAVRREVEAGFVRTPMAEFEYLASAAKPTWGWLAALYGATAGLTLLLGWWLHEKEIV